MTSSMLLESYILIKKRSFVVRGSWFVSDVYFLDGPVCCVETFFENVGVLALALSLSLSLTHTHKAARTDRTHKPPEQTVHTNSTFMLPHINARS